MSYTFDVCLAKDKSFTVNHSKLEANTSAKDAITRMVGSKLEQASKGEAFTFSKRSLVDISMHCFDEHRHMYLDPDTIWITIEQGLAEHIKQNAEELRHHFVDFEGKTTIGIQRDHFIKGEENDWEGCFPEFSEKIGEFIGKKRDLIVSDFSTTTKLSKVASEIVLMDAMSEYFDYEVTTLCGIPSVTLEGTVEDWESIRERVKNITEFDLQWWTSELLPVLDEIVKSAKGNPDISFWQEWYSVGGGSGGPFISGHVAKFYPYTGHSKKSRTDFSKLKGSMFGGLTMGSIPNGISSVPFIWNYYSQRIPMEFIGGIIGIQGTDDGGVRSAFGWALRETAVPLSNYPKDRWQVGMVVHDSDDKRGVLEDAEFTEYGEPDDPHYSKRVDAVIIKWDGDAEVTKIKQWDSEYRKVFVKETCDIDPEKVL